MEGQPKINTKTIAIAVLILAFIALGIWYWRGRKPVKEPFKAPATPPVLQFQTNPAEKLPEVNPLEKTNPFKYKNPLR